MTHRSFTRQKIVSASIVSLAVTAMMGCAGQIDEGDAPDYQFAIQTAQWTHCADQGQRCEFTGTRQVRFGVSGRTTTGTFTDGVTCSNRSFGVRYGRGNMCDLLVEVPVETAVDAAVDAGSASADHTTHADAGTDAAVGATAMGPTINRNAIPTGDPGVSTQEISPTSEKPVPDPDIGAFRTSCLFSHMNFDDAIVFPGKPGAAHLHAYFGNTLSSASSTAESMRTTGNSTCRGGTANRTSYWVPAVIDGAGNPVKPTVGEFYYKTGYEGIAPAEIQVFPQSLRMIAGDGKASAPGQSHARWTCLNNGGKYQSNIPTCPVGDHVMMVIQFPQCWDGKNLDSTDHKSHMSYPVNGDCPSTHPVAIPEITFNIRYKVTAATNSSGWRLSSDMYGSSLPGGYSAHGDYFEGWDRTVAETFVKNCDRASMDCHSHLLGDGRMIYNSHETY